MAVNEFLIFLYWVHMFSLSFFIWNYSLFKYLSLFDLILLLTSSYAFVPLFFTENEAEIMFL